MEISGIRLPCLPAEGGCQPEEQEEKVQWEIGAATSRELLTKIVFVFDRRDDALHDRSSLDNREDLRRRRRKRLRKRSKDGRRRLLSWRYVHGTARVGVYSW